MGSVWPPTSVTIKYRVDLQRIWQYEYDWDQPLPDDMVQIWRENMQQMSKLVEIMVNRCLMPSKVKGPPQLHTFPDGGDYAYGTCVFLRWPTSDGPKIVFVSAKVFVAPLKRKTIPRLELMGAVAMSSLVKEIELNLNYKFEYKRYWTDSEVVMYWLNTTSCNYKPFVSSRIQEFHDSHPNWRQEIRHIPSEENPADCLTKHISMEDLPSWLEGEFCTFLKLSEGLWPTCIGTDNIDTERLKPFLEKSIPSNDRAKRRKRLKPKDMNKQKEDSMELNLSLNNSNIATGNEDLSYFIAKCLPKWAELVRAVSYMKQIFESRTFKRQLSHTPENIRNAEMSIYFMCQKDLRIDMNKTKIKFIKYNPTFDENRIIRGKGRLENTNLPEEIKYPIILPGEHPVVGLLVMYHHKRLLDQGYRVLLVNLMNIGIIIGGGKILLKSISAKCLFCRIRRRKLLQQQMGNLPNFRVQVRNAPFASVAIDLFGYLNLRLSRNVVINGSVMIVACTTTRCIHLEVCSTLDTNSFLQAWRRFTTSRRVHPNHVFSDGGGTFKGAHQPISEWIQNWDHHLIETEFQQTKFECGWKFNVPTASHKNGIVESLINSVRKGLDAGVINYTRQVLTYED